MQFGHTWQKVLSKEKTQTRRIVKPGEEGGGLSIDLHPFWNDKAKRLESHPYSEVYHDGRLKWQVGRTYAVQPGRGKAAVGRIRITAIRKEKVKDITEEDAFAEGCKKGEIWESGPNEWGYTFKFQTKAQFEFKTLWEEVHGPGAWERNDGVWVLEYELVTEAEPA